MACGDSPQRASAATSRGDSRSTLGWSFRTLRASRGRPFHWRRTHASCRRGGSPSLRRCQLTTSERSTVVTSGVDRVRVPGQLHLPATEGLGPRCVAKPFSVAGETPPQRVWDRRQDRRRIASRRVADRPSARFSDRTHEVTSVPRPGAPGRFSPLWVILAAGCRFWSWRGVAPTTRGSEGDAALRTSQPLLGQGAVRSPCPS